MRMQPAELEAISARALECAGARPAMAARAAGHLVLAETHGLPSHGLSRVPFYCSMLRNGRADGRAHPTLAAERAAVVLIDNHDALPYEACAWAIDEAAMRARRNGIAFAGIRASGHAGVLGIHLLPLVARGLVGVAFTNSPAAIPPWGGRRALFGTNPVAFAFPRQASDPLVIDLALTTVTRGKVMLALQREERIPEGWALDREGAPTTDPKEAIEHGSMFPIGGAKGAMLALGFELVCAALTGAAIGAEADSLFSEAGNRPRLGQVFLAIDPDALSGRAVFLERVETVVAAMCADAGVRLPGARRFAAARAAQAQGIDVPDALLAQIDTLGRG